MLSGLWYRLKYLNIPYHAVEHPAFNEYDSEQSHRNKIEYMIVQELEAIEWAEKTTGKKFDDEAYIKGLYISARIRNLWGQICLLNQNIPAPLDEKSMFSFCIIGGIVGGNQTKALEVMQMLRDEIEDRVKNEIAAVATERYRIMHAGSPDWYALSIFRYFEKFGALSIGSRYTFTRGGGTILDMGGRELPHQTFEQRGLVLKTREDAVRAVVEEGRLNQETWKSFRFTGHEGTELELRMAKLWKCDGAVLHFNRGCEHQAHGQPQVRLAFVDAGIPVMNYEASMADAREWDEARTFARIDAFFESQGIEKLED